MLNFMRRIWGIILVVSLLLNAGLFGAGATAQASSGKIWARWKVELDFTEGKINAVWTVAIGDYDMSVSPEKMQLITYKSFKIECTPHGSFYIDQQAREAVFDGKGYLECPTPSFYQAALDLAKESRKDLGPNFMERCSCVNPIPWVTGDLTVTPSESPNPIVHEVNGAIDFYTPLAPGNEAQSILRLNGQLTGPAFAWALREKGNQLWSGVGVESFQVLDATNPSWDDYLVDFSTAAKSTPADHFLQWEDPNNYVMAPGVSSLNITNLETTFTIGYDGHNYFVGRIRKLAWDPGCTPV